MAQYGETVKNNFQNYLLSLILWCIIQVEITMLDTEYDCLLRFVRAVLDDDRGISEAAYLRLRQLADVMHECQDHAERSHLIEGIIDRIDATDGRFYLGDMTRAYTNPENVPCVDRNSTTGVAN